MTHSQEPTGEVRLGGANKWESNCVRTVLMHAAMHTQARSLRPGGAICNWAPLGQGLAVVLKAEQPWRGTLVFDIPRHRLFLGFQRDWPRMNTLPEWFTVEPEAQYIVEGLPGAPQQMTGSQLRDGLPLELESGGELRLSASPAP